MIPTHIVAFGLIVSHLACPALPQSLATTTITSQTKTQAIVRSTVSPLGDQTLLPPIATTEKITTRTLPRPFAPTTAEPSTIALPSPTSTTSVPPGGYIPPFLVSTEMTPRNLSDQTNSSFKISGNTTSSVALFGLPAFCSYSAVETCSNIPLKQCNDCTMVGAGFFVLFLVVLGVAIICSNAAIIMLFVSGKSTFTGTYGKIKASLAFADILTGLLLFCVVFPNFSRTINSSPEELLRITLTSFGSPEASVGGVFFIFITTSSLYHLVLLAQQRLYAVKWPIKYKQQNENTVYIGIALVWVLALLFAVVPLFFPNKFSFAYQQLTFLFSLTMRDMTSNTVGPLIGILVVVYLFPYLVMSGFTLATAIYIQKYIKRGSKMRSGDTGKQEIMIFRTLATMQLGFTITMIPLLVIIVMSYSGAFTPHNIAAPYMVCFYLSMSNSLVNVMVYSVMDKKFRKSVRNLFVIRLRKERQCKPVASSASKD